MCYKKCVSLDYFLMKKYTFISCLSCGRAIKGVEAHDDEFPETMFCLKCKDEDNKVKPFPSILEIVTKDILKDCDCEYDEAQERAKDRLKRMDYWKERGKGWKLPNVPA